MRLRVVMLRVEEGLLDEPLVELPDGSQVLAVCSPLLELPSRLWRFPERATASRKPGRAFS
jgi:hypothetical protein